MHVDTRKNVMMNKTENYKIEEYKEIRNEIRARESAIAVFFQIVLISSVTILSGISVFSLI